MKTQLVDPASTVVHNNTFIYMPVNRAYINVSMDQQEPTKILWRTKDGGGKQYTAWIALDGQGSVDDEGQCYVSLAKSPQKAKRGQADALGIWTGWLEIMPNKRCLPY